MSIIKQTDKKTGITYAYETTYRWDKEKKQSRAVRKCIGKVEPQSGEIVPTRGRGKKGESLHSKTHVTKQGSKPFSGKKHLYFGATYLLESFANEIGLTHDLQICFPVIYKQILSIAFYLILEDNNPLYRFEKWHLTHKHPYGSDIASPRSSELFSSITDEQVGHFFGLQARRRIDEEYWAYDSTSISSYSETLSQIQYGKNKENDCLPQLNLLLVFGEKSGLPFYYRKLAGNIPDVITVKHLLEDLNILGFGKTKFVMDRGFYSESNINGMYKEHVKFIVATKLSLRLIKSNLERISENICMPMYYDECSSTYGYTVMTDWDYTQVRPNIGDTIKDTRRIYIHYYFNIDRMADETGSFDKKIAGLHKELMSGKLIESHTKAYEQYFIITDNGRKIGYNVDAIKQAKKYMGYFALISNEKMDAFTALHLYRMKDIIEKAFGNLKERLNLRRLLVSSELSLDGKIFVEFIALILISYLDHKMKENKLYADYTMQQLLDKLDLIECFEDKGHKLRVGEILRAQEKIYEQLDVSVPTSSCLA